MLSMTKLKRAINACLAPIGAEIIPFKKTKRDGLNLNIGCGNYEIKGFVSVDYFTEHYYRKNKFRRVHYDMRNDDLPFADATVDTIYCSHVIEHIERRYVRRFFIEALRCLKPGGTLRIACPNAAFLYYQMRNYPSYFSWHRLYKTRQDAELCFVSLLASHKADKPEFGLSKPLLAFDYKSLAIALEERGEFDKDNPGRHICIWDFDAIQEEGLTAGFSAIEKSHCKGSSVPALQGQDMDRTHPEMSLYVELHR